MDGVSAVMRAGEVGDEDAVDGMHGWDSGMFSNFISWTVY